MFPYHWLTSFRADWSFPLLDGQSGPQFEANEINISPHTSAYPNLDLAYSDRSMDVTYTSPTSKSTQTTIIIEKPDAAGGNLVTHNRSIQDISKKNVSKR